MRILTPRRLSTRVGVIMVALAAGSAWCAHPVFAGTSSGTSGVSQKPASGTPQLVPASKKANETIRQLEKCGGRMYAVGEFKTITQGGKTLTRNNIFSFKASPPYDVTSWNPAVNGEVNSIAFAGTCADAYIGGSFTSVNGSSADNIAKISTSTGSLVTSFAHDANNNVDTLLAYNGHLLTGGRFTSVNGDGRHYYASLNPTTGRDDGFVPNLNISGQEGNDPSKVYNQQLNHSGKRVLIEGSFTSVDHQSRQQMFMLNLAATHAELTGWTSPAFAGQCIAREGFYIRSAAWSPDDTAIYTASTGFHPLNWNGSFPLTGLCDAVAAFPTNWQSVNPRWIQYSGCDSYYSVAADSSSVYAAGHPRWAENKNGCNHAGPNAIPDAGLQGFNPSNGTLLETSGAPRYSMSRANADDMLITGAGLWIASSNRFNSDKCDGASGHAGICFLPYN